MHNFENFITDTTLHRMFVMGAYQMFVAMDQDRIIGMITLRDTSHISLLFVDAKYHRRGIGRMLIQYVGDYVFREEGHSFVTVNAAPYAVGFYHRVGFVDTDTRQFNDGIWYTPMQKSVK